MTLQQIDEALAAWNSRLAAIADNLLWLQNDSTYQMLTGSGGATQLPVSGVTAQRVHAALQSMHRLFDHFSILHANLDRAVEIRKTVPAIFGGEQKLAEIEHLLFGRSIQLPASAAPTGQRSLLSGAHSGDCRTPDEVLEPMVKVFAAARDAVLDVERAWRDLARGVDLAEARILQLQSLPLAPESAAPDSASVEQRLQAIRHALQSDPLGALAELNSEILPQLNELHQRIETAQQTRQDLLEAHTHFDQLAALHRETLATTAEAQAKIAGFLPAHQPIAQEKLEQLRQWLDQLDRRHAEGVPGSVTAGLANWRAAVAGCVAQERSAAAANRASLETRRELRGRLDALKAKARARGIAEASDLTGIATQAETLLTTRPTNLDLTAAAVALYAKVVNAASREA